VLDFNVSLIYDCARFTFVRTYIPKHKSESIFYTNILTILAPYDPLFRISYLTSVCICDTRVSFFLLPAQNRHKASYIKKKVRECAFSSIKCHFRAILLLARALQILVNYCSRINIHRVRERERGREKERCRLVAKKNVQVYVLFIAKCRIFNRQYFVARFPFST